MSMYGAGYTTIVVPRLSPPSVYADLKVLLIHAREMGEPGDEASLSLQYVIWACLLY